MSWHQACEVSAIVAPPLAAAIIFANLPKVKHVAFVLYGLACIGMGLSNLMEMLDGSNQLFLIFDPVFSIALSGVMALSGFFALTEFEYPAISAKAYLACVGGIFAAMIALHVHSDWLHFAEKFDEATSVYAVLAAVMGFLAYRVRRPGGPRKTAILVGMVASGALFASLNLGYHELGEAAKVLLRVSNLVFVSLMMLEPKEEMAPPPNDGPNATTWQKPSQMQPVVR